MYQNIKWFIGKDYYQVRGWLEKQGFSKTSNCGFFDQAKTKGWQEFDNGTETITVKCNMKRGKNGNIHCADVYDYQNKIYDNKQMRTSKQAIYESIMKNINKNLKQTLNEAIGNIHENDYQGWIYQSCKDLQRFMKKHGFKIDVDYRQDWEPTMYYATYEINKLPFRIQFREPERYEFEKGKHGKDSYNFWWKELILHIHKNFNEDREFEELYETFKDHRHVKDIIQAIDQYHDVINNLANDVKNRQN